jgi:glucose-1-phosphate cytidylyltransferase
MKIVILAGGLGTRLAEETEIKPKPMVDIGDKPILWHIMKHFRFHGFKEFVIALGYKGELIKRWFVDELALSGSMSVDVGRGILHPGKREVDDWLVHLVDTGSQTNTGGRLRRLRKWLGNEPFLVTYGDGLGDVPIHDLVEFHRRHRKLATVTAVRPPARYGGILFDGDLVANFTEKPQAGEGWINGGFIVMEPRVLDLIEDDSTSLEKDVLEKLAENRELVAYKHDRFWQCMDTLRDKRFLQALWAEGRAPWKTWS